eukprot:scaffold83763_cov36-Phaeocystis_antarctica.AAC.2
MPSASRIQEPGESAPAGWVVSCGTTKTTHNALPATGVSATDGGRSSLSAAAATSGPPSAAPSTAPSRPPSRPPPESFFRRRRCFLERRGCTGAGATSALLRSRRRAGGCSRVCPPSKSSLR